MNRKTELKAELEKSAAYLRQLQEQVRVQVHLGKLDAVQKWNELEPRIEAALERAGREVSEASHKAVDEAIATLKKLS
jgi:hypothetical protein